MEKTNFKRATAHQLWCNSLNKEVVDVLWTRKTVSKKFAFLTTRAEIQQQTNAIMGGVTHVMGTRFRVIIDALLAMGDACEIRSRELQKERRDLALIQFKKFRDLTRAINEQRILQAGYINAIKAIADTRPPGIVDCATCRGTGVIGGDECHECTGTGVTAQKIEIDLTPGADEN